MSSNPDAARAETEPATTATFSWEGMTVTIPATIEDVDPDVIEAFENGKAITGIRAIFGDLEYERLRARFAKKHGHRPTMKDLGATENPSSDSLFAKIAEHYGFDGPGE